MEQENSVRNGIKFWALDDRPREKMMEKGQAALSNAELVAILIQNGTPEKSAVDLAREVLAITGNNLNSLGKLNHKDFQVIRGIGEAKAITLMAALELGRRRQAEFIPKRTSITSSRMAADILIPVLQDYKYEVFCVMYLNRGNKLIRQEIISHGGLTATVVDIRIIMKHALDYLAASIFISHNHPSGSLRPSKADRELTQKIKNAGQLLDITLVDHLIIGQQDYFSFADEGIL